MVRVCENRGRSAARPDFLENLAVCPLGKSTATIFLRCGHPKDTDTTEPLDHISWNVRCSIDCNGIQFLVEKLAHLGQRLIELNLLRSRNAWIRHCPIRNKPPKKKPLGKSQRLRSGKKQLLRFFDFFLPLDFRFVHKFTPLY